MSPDDDPGILLSAMGEFQDQQHTTTDDHDYPTMVSADWPFHELRTGLSRERICALLPQLVSHGLAQGLGGGMVWGYRVSDGYAWISERGQAQLRQWRDGQPACLEHLAALGPHAEDALSTLLAQATDLRVTEQDLDRFETALRRIPPAAIPCVDNDGDTRTSPLRHDADLPAFAADHVLPFLRVVLAAHGRRDA